MYIFHILCYIQRSYGCLKKHNSDVTVMRIIVKIYTDIRKKKRPNAEKSNVDNPCMVYSIYHTWIIYRLNKEYKGEHIRGLV